jgi:hypothetical protein
MEGGPCLQEISVCSIVGALVVAIIVYNILQTPRRQSSADPPCDSCGKSATSARNAELTPIASPPVVVADVWDEQNSVPGPIDPNGPTPTATTIKAGISRGLQQSRYNFLSDDGCGLLARNIGYNTNLLASITRAMNGKPQQPCPTPATSAMPMAAPE